jgi:hypothetical protein
MTSLPETFRFADYWRREPERRRVLVPLVVCISIVCAGTPLRADETFESGRRMQFDIPAQPLVTALDVYCAATGIQMFVDTGLIARRRSAAVQGEFTRENALQGLLSGTGLAARFVGDQGFTLVSLSPEPDAGMAQASSLVNQRVGAYSALLRTGLRKALCRYEQTRPGTYRFLGRLWIGALGTVSRVELITSTGSVTRDARLLATLRDMTIGEAPPPDLPQPVTVLLAADPLIAEGYCSGTDAGPPVKAAAEARH